MTVTTGPEFKAKDSRDVFLELPKAHSLWLETQFYPFTELQDRLGYVAWKAKHLNCVEGLLTLGIGLYSAIISLISKKKKKKGTWAEAH